MSKTPPPEGQLFPFYKLDDDLKYQVMFTACRQDPSQASRLKQVDRHSEKSVASFAKIDGLTIEVSRDADAFWILGKYSDDRFGRLLRETKPLQKSKDGPASTDPPLHIKAAEIFHPVRDHFLKSDEDELSKERYDQLKRSRCLHQDVFLELVATLTKHDVEAISIIRLDSDSRLVKQRLEESWLVSTPMWECLGTGGTGRTFLPSASCHLATPRLRASSKGFALTISSKTGLNGLRIYGNTSALPHQPLNAGEEGAFYLPSAFQSLGTLWWVEPEPAHAYRALVRILPYCHSLEHLYLGVHTGAVDDNLGLRPTPAYCLVNTLVVLNLSSLPIKDDSNHPGGLFHLIPALEALKRLSIRPSHLSKFFRGQCRHHRRDPNSREAFTVEFELDELRFYSEGILENLFVTAIQIEGFIHALEGMVPFKVITKDDATATFLQSFAKVPNDVGADVFVISEIGPGSDWKGWEGYCPYLDVLHKWFKARFDNFAALHSFAFEESYKDGRSLVFESYQLRVLPPSGTRFFRPNGTELGKMAERYLTSVRDDTLRRYELDIYKQELEEYGWRIINCIFKGKQEALV